MTSKATLILPPGDRAARKAFIQGFNSAIGCQYLRMGNRVVPVKYRSIGS